MQSLQNCGATDRQRSSESRETPSAWSEQEQLCAISRSTGLLIGRGRGIGAYCPSAMADGERSPKYTIRRLRGQPGAATPVGYITTA